MRVVSSVVILFVALTTACGEPATTSTAATSSPATASPNAISPTATVAQPTFDLATVVWDGTHADDATRADGHVQGRPFVASYDDTRWRVEIGAF